MSDKDQRKVPLLRFKGFTNDWEQRKFGDFWKLKSGKAYKASEYVNKGIPIINGETIKNGEIKSNNLNYLPKRYLLIKDNIILKPDDVVIGLNRPIINNQLKISPIPKNIPVSFLYQRAGKIESKFSNLSTIETYYLLERNIFNFSKITAIGSDQPFIKTSALLSWKFFIPKEIEEKTINKLLAKISTLIFLQQQKNADIINLKKAILDKIFSNSNIQKWRDIRLNKVLSIPVDEPKEVTNIDDIISVKLNTQGISKIPNRSTLKLGSTKYYVRHGGQFIFGKQNFFNGSMAIIPSEYDGKVSSKDVPSLNINKDIVMPYFLWLYLSRPSFYKKTERWATGTGSKRLHIKDLLSLKIYIPNKNEQLRICKLMRSLDTQILKSQKHLKELQSIKKFLLQNMFI